MAIVYQSIGVKAYLTVVWIALTPIEQAFATSKTSIAVNAIKTTVMKATQWP